MPYAMSRLSGAPRRKVFQFVAAAVPLRAGPILSYTERRAAVCRMQQQGVCVAKGEYIERQAIVALVAE